MPLKDIFAVILAAGKGKRMKSDLPKVLHELNGKPLLGWVLDTVAELGILKTVVVVGHMGKIVADYIAGYYGSREIELALQDELLGTADAVKRALPLLPQSGTIIVLCGDVPLIRAATIRKLLDEHRNTGAAATILTAMLDNPSGYGRILRAADRSVVKIVEHRDAMEDELQIREINSGTYAFEIAPLCEAIDMVDNSNTQGEFYLTDVIHILRARGHRISAISVDDSWEVEGVNSPEQLIQLNRHLAHFGVK